MPSLPAAILALALAVLATIAGYATLHVWNRVPGKTADEAAGDPRAPERNIERPSLSRLAPLAEAMPASLRDELLPRPVGALTVNWTSPGVEIGLAVIDGESGALLAWREPRDVAADTRWALDPVATGTHWAVVAHRADLAHAGYVTRARAEIAADGSGSVALDPSLRAVHIELVSEDPAERSNLAQAWVAGELRRTDDPRWLYRRDGGRAGLMFARGDAAHTADVRLGAGRYRLRLNGVEVVAADADKLEFDVPGADRITIRCRRR